jgi:two-component sensor histidine kinase/putative methionine-R-sulfoxide reductase with GAF domain
MPVNVPLQSLSERLSAELAASFDPHASGPIVGGETVLRAFDRFGAAARNAGITLSDALTAAAESLSRYSDRFVITATDEDRFHATGVALAAVATSHAQPDHPIPVLENDRSRFPETQHARLDALHQINRAATSNLQLSEMLDTVVKVVKATTSSDASAVFLYSESTGLLSLEATDGLNKASVGNVTVRIGEGIIGRAAIEGQLISAPNARQHESFLAHPAIGDDKYSSQVSVPMLLQGQDRLVGILNIHSIDPRIYDQDELEFLRTVAGELAISIENARQYSSTDQKLHQKIEELGTLQRVGRMLASTLEVNAVLEMITENAVEISHAEAAAIFRPSKTNGSQPWNPIIESRIGLVRQLENVKTRNDVVGEVFRTGAAIQMEIQYVDGPALLFCLPLRSARGLVGAICFRFATNAELDKDVIGLLQAFSDSAAMAIENAELYQDAMRSVQTQRTLVQEMHHRVRNNLQTVAALRSLQLRRAEDAPWAVEIREAISRIQSIAAVHDLLSDEKRLGGTTVDVIARMVAEDAHSTLIPPGLRVTFDIHPSDLQIPSRQATIMSLLINELAANAISHGFENRDRGYIRIRAWNDDGMANVEVFNDGQKVPEGFQPAQSQGLGMKITHRLVTSDLHGSFMIGSDEAGTTALIRFPIAVESHLETAL